MNESNDAVNKLLVPGAVILAGLLIAGAVIFAGKSPTTGGNTGGQQVTVDIKDVTTEGEPFIGEANAPVTLAFWSDFQCPYCKAFETGGIPQIPTPAALPEIIKNYVETGKVKIVFKDFAFLGQDSIAAGEYARAMWKLYPDKYFDWRTAMYTAQDAEGDQGFGDEASIKDLTKKVAGVDVVKVTADVTANKSAYDAAMQADQKEGQKMGINATPSFITGDQVISGAQPYAAFQAAFDAQL